MMKKPDAQMGSLYDGLWKEAQTAFALGDVEVDRFLTNPQEDRRLGVTVIARPSAGVIEKFCGFVGRLEQVVPGQYFYRPGEMHVTVLSLFTAVEDHGHLLARLPEYLDVCREVLSDAKGFAVHFCGVTASRSSILAQGFPQDGYLENLREQLRVTLRRRDLGGGLDTRYHITTAHSTMMRFKSVPTDLPGLLNLLREYRGFPFGCTTIELLQVVKNDWYMSLEKTELLAEYMLKCPEYGNRALALEKENRK
jgi:2'-5' RNA ligase